MIAYHESYKTFKEHMSEGSIVDEILHSMGQSVSGSEIRSWKNSLKEVYTVLSFSELPEDVEIAIEYKLPISLKRIDFLIAGSDGTKDNVIVIELKQWSQVTKTDMPGTVEMQGRLYPHPSWQAYSYTKVLSFFNEAIEKNSINLYPCAFLHNYKATYASDLTDEIYDDAIGLAPVFIESEYKELKEFIEKYIKVKSNKNLLFEIDQGKIRPSKMLIDVLGNMLNNNDEFTLIDEQKVTSDYLYKLSVESHKSSNKHVIIVEGGAGTGKTVIAIDLLGKLITKKAFKTFFVSKSSYLRENFFSKLTKGVPEYVYLKTLFKGSGSFIASDENDFDVLIVDEAHRLMRQTKRSWFFNGMDQVMEIINASKVSIFFIDPKQRIDIKDHGSIETIKKWADYFGAEVHHSPDLNLKAQFRCNGSDKYVQWVDSLLYNQPFEETDDPIDYDIKLFDNIHEMKNALKEKNHSNKARMIAGDVFPWISRQDKSLIDIKFDGFEAQWNRTTTFATDPNSFDEVGCIHTTQGMEFEYVGLIISEDLIYRDGKVMTDYTKHPDGANEFKRPKQRKVDPSDELELDQLIRNTYRVLFSRGQKGVYIYCRDMALHDYLNDQINLLIDNNGNNK